MVDAVVRLFLSTATTFVSNGIGYLPDVISCTVVEERNGSFELTMVYPITGLRYSEIMTRRILVAKSNPFSEPQPFRIYRITKPIKGKVTIYAAHISYDLSGIPVRPFTAVNAVNAITSLKTNAMISCPFTFSTDKGTVANFKVIEPTSIRSLLGGMEGSILDTYRGEYLFDRFSVKLLANRGTTRGVTIRYAKNMTDLEQDENVENLYTGVLPYWYSDLEEGGGYVQGNIVKCPGTYNFEKILTLDCSYDFQNKPTVAQLTQFANTYISNNSIGVPKISIDVSFVNLAASEEFKNIAIALETIQLCDTVAVEYAELGVKATAKCIKTTYDVLTDHYEKLELGDAKLNLSDTLASNNDKLANDFRKKLISTNETTTEEFKKNLEDQYNDLFGKIIFGDDTLNGLIDDVNGRVDQTNSNLNETNSNLNKSNTDLNKKIDDKASEFTGNLKTMHDEIDKELLNMDKDLKKLIKDTVEEEASERDKAVAYATNMITGNLGGYVILHSSTNADYPDEILIMDNEDVTKAKKIWRWNKSGLGYSSTGYNGPYGTAITQEGVIVADYIQSGVINASLITTGVLDANLITAGFMSCDRLFGGSLVLGGKSNGNGLLILRDADNKLIASMNNSGLAVYKGSINGPSITIGGKSNQSGVIQILDGDGAASGLWDNNGITMYGTYRFRGADYSGVMFYRGLSLQCQANIGGTTQVIYFQSSVEIAEMISSSSGLTTEYIPCYGFWTRDYRLGLGFIYTLSSGGWSLRHPFVMKNRDRYGGSYDSIVMNAEVAIERNLTVGAKLTTFQLETHGTKNRIVDTKSFGTVALNAVESPEAVFTDFGSGKISKSGTIYIYFDPIFLEVIEEPCEYQVFTTKTSPGLLDYVEKKQGYFIAHGEADVEFDWMVSCKQRDYSSTRFEEREPFHIDENTEKETLLSQEEYENAQKNNWYYTTQNIYG